MLVALSVTLGLIASGTQVTLCRHMTDGADASADCQYYLAGDAVSNAVCLEQYTSNSFSTSAGFSFRMQIGATNLYYCTTPSQADKCVMDTYTAGGCSGTATALTLGTGYDSSNLRGLVGTNNENNFECWFDQIGDLWDAYASPNDNKGKYYCLSLSGSVSKPYFLSPPSSPSSPPPSPSTPPLSSPPSTPPPPSLPPPPPPVGSCETSVVSSLIALLSASCQTAFTNSVTNDVAVSDAVACPCFLEVVPQVTAGTLVLPDCYARPGGSLTILSEYNHCVSVYKPPSSPPPPPSLPPPPPSSPLPTPPPPSPPPPFIPPLSPFAPLTVGEVVVEEEAQIVTVSVTLAGDIASIDQAALTASMATTLGCVSPCQLELTLSSASVDVTAKMTVPTSAASTASSVAANAQSFASSSASDVNAFLGAAGVTVVAVSPVVYQTKQTVAIKVAPPPPSLPPSTPPAVPPPSPTSPTSSGGSNTGGIIGGVVGGVSAPMFAAIGYYVYKKKKMSQTKVVDSSYS